MLSERLGIDMDGAFTALRDHVRGHKLKLADLARTILDDRAWPHELFNQRKRTHQRRSGSAPA
ncbi:ANTAR domain-containing protein [Amycolatopsis sp. NPDC049159]|uniref:ANTAR domain-containing protein n=1 Tax=Amycolatopsis sp. NPDC049159 TaxID=3157210 RepID=UPI003410C615